MKGNADWLSDLPSVIKKRNNTIPSSAKTSLNRASMKMNEKTVYSYLRDKRKRLKPIYKLVQLVRTPDNINVFSKCKSINWSYKLYTITEVIHDSVPRYRIEYLPERYNENLLRSKILTLDEKNQVMKRLNLLQKNQW